MRALVVAVAILVALLAGCGGTSHKLVLDAQERFETVCGNLDTRLEAVRSEVMRDPARTTIDEADFETETQEAIKVMEATEKEVDALPVGHSENGHKEEIDYALESGEARLASLAQDARRYAPHSDVSTLLLKGPFGRFSAVEFVVDRACRKAVPGEDQSE
jgi:hypothetical protein